MRLLAEIALIAIAAVGGAVCVARLPRAEAGSRHRRPPEQSRPEQLIAVERLIVNAQSTQLNAHAYLRPVLAEIASRRLGGHGHALETMPDERGRRLLGELLWDIVRPGRPFPEDRSAPGISSAQLGEMLDVLEGL